MQSRGIYDRQGELFAYLVGTVVYDLDDTQKGYVQEGCVYAMNDEKLWLIRGDGLYTLKGEAVGYLGANFRES